MASPIATAAVQIVPTFKGLHKETQKGLAGTEREFGKSGKKSGSLLSKAFKGMAVAGIGAAGGAIASGFGIAMAKGFQRLNAIDQAEKKLQGLGHSAKDVEGIMKNALNSVKGTAFGLDEAANVSASLVASGIKPGKELEQTLKTVADSATIAGIGMEDMGAIFGKVAATGKLQGDELNQLSERGIPALQLLSEHLGVTTQEVRDMVSKGQVDFKTFAAAMDAGMGGAALKSGETFMGAWANVKAALGRIGATLLEPLFEALKDSFNVLTPALDRIQESAEPLAAVFGDMLKAVMPLATAVFTGLVQGFVALAEALGKNAGLVKALTGVVVFAATAYAGWAAGAKMLVWYQTLHKAITPGLTAVLKGQVTVTGLLSKGWKALSAAMAANPIGVVIVALIALGALFVLMYKKVGWFRDAVNAAWAGIKAAVAVFVDWFKTNVQPIISQVLSALGTAFKWLYETIIKPYLTAAGKYFTFLWNVAKAVFGGMVWYIQNIVAPVYVWLYEHVIKPVFGALKTYFTVLWAGVKLIFQGLSLFFRTIVGPVFVWLYQNIIKPVFAGIQTAVVILWNAIKLYFTALVAFYRNIVGPVFVWLYQNIVKPVFAGIKLVIQVWWTAVKLIFNALVIFFRAVLGPIFRWLLNSVVKPVFNTIKAVIQFWWTGVKNIFNACMSFIRNTLAPVFRWFLNGVIRPVWNGVKSVINTVWVFIRDRVFAPLKNAIQHQVPNAFRTGVNGIKRFWNQLEGVAKKPVRFVIDTVVNKGVIDNFNKIAGTFNVKKLSRVNLPRGFATGGRVTGPGSGTSDDIPAWLSNGEFVVNARATRKWLPLLHAINGPKGVGFNQTMRALQRKGALGAWDYINYGGENRFATGGEVSPMVVKAQQWARSQVGKPYIWGGVGPAGYDCSGFMSAITNVLTGRPPHRRLFATGSFSKGRGVAGFKPGLKSAFAIGVSPNTGRGIGHTGGTLGGMNVESYGGHGPATGKGARGATDRMFPWQFYLPMAGGQFIGGEGGGVDVLSFLNPFNALKNLIGKIPGTGYMLDFAKGAAKKVIGWPIDFIKSKIGSITDAAGAVVDSINGGTAKAQVRAAAALYGWGSGSEWSALDWLINRESSWNPRAANPTSSARGLFQKMTSIHGPVEATAGGQAGWGLKYIKGRYGSPSAAMRFHKSRGYYARGGEVKKYDSGGWLMPGLTTTVNATGKPEAVFTNEQFQHIKAAALGGGRGLTIETLQAMDMDDAVRRLAVYEQRRRVLYPEGV